jgi:acyl carrier protein phosphodiesterase
VVAGVMLDIMFDHGISNQQQLYGAQQKLSEIFLILNSLRLFI